VYEQYRDRLPETWRRRAEHWMTEYERVEQGAEAWRRGDIETYGRLSFESGHSSIYNWETGSPELKTLYEIMTHTDGIYGVLHSHGEFITMQRTRIFLTAGSRHMTHYHHQFALYVIQKRTPFRNQSYQRIEHVNLSVCLNARIVLADSNTIAKAGLAAVACLCVNMFHRL